MGNAAFTPRQIVQALSEKLNRYYIFPQVAQDISRHLESNLTKGAFADILDGELLALALTMHMQEISHDEHLWVKWHPNPLPLDDDTLRCNPEWQSERKMEACLDNFGIHKVERLPGNIGFLDLHYFHRVEWSEDTIGSAMKLLSHTDALIIDLRNCSGGYPATVALLSSFFFKETSIPLFNIYWQDDGTTQEIVTRADIPGELYIEKPVYVLTSRVTFSAGEAFASFLQVHKRAIVLGEKTDGGTHPGASYRLHPHFEAFIAIGRTYDPLTGKDLEGIGIIPDIAIQHEHAFTTAYQMAVISTINKLEGFPSEVQQNLIREAKQALSDLGSTQEKSIQGQFKET